MRGIKQVRRVLVVIGVYATLFWSYLVARILLVQAHPPSTFIDDFPSFLGIPLTFMTLGMVTFVTGFLAFSLWGVLYAKKSS